MESVTNYELMQKLKEIEEKLNNLNSEFCTFIKSTAFPNPQKQEAIKEVTEEDAVRADIPEDMRWMLNFK